jgi:NADH dehydrogenase [ubiquinone] 1 alpha subcomplex assembly factor 5
MEAPVPSLIDGPFDRRLRRLRRDRAARLGGAFYLHQRAAAELLDRLTDIKRDFRDVLDLGCGDGYLSSELSRRGLAVTSADAGALFAANLPNSAQCDEDRLPFGDSSFDLIVSVGVLDTVNDLPGALVLLRRSLRPDGLFLAAFAGAGSLPRLRSAMSAADSAEGGGAAPRLHPQIEVRAAGDLLARAGFALPVADADSVEIRFSGLPSLLGDLRAMAGTNILAARSRTPLTRLGLAAAMADFRESSDPDGKTAERVEIIYLTAWAPAVGQPQPARRGSGTVSLAATLGKPR